ncbi:MAG: hypothetical protein A3G93_08475 [Nitrospinae bacterium RIFCSPLOWO2_12_FULL_45_22]|nr:MAG: hypothetical protein A3G93_08475 [Nitrospinae bacterium RIFCSPLOWO2_12_FULL_45_22]
MGLDKQIISLYQQGKGIKAIAKELGTYPNAIKRVLVKVGAYNFSRNYRLKGDRVTRSASERECAVCRNEREGISVCPTCWALIRQTLEINQAILRYRHK